LAKCSNVALGNPECYIEITEILVRFNADLNIQDGEGKSGVFWAAETGKVLLLEHLLTKYAEKINFALAENRNRDTVLHLACKSLSLSTIRFCYSREVSQIILKHLSSQTRNREWINLQNR